jgi:hypothetical protein
MWSLAQRDTVEIGASAATRLRPTVRHSFVRPLPWSVLPLDLTPTTKAIRRASQPISIPAPTYANRSTTPIAWLVRRA